jgi:DNA-directed RNA polymerase II subunit RPB2
MAEPNVTFHTNMDNPIDHEDSWKVIDSYFKQNGLVAQQIFSYERFLQYSIQEIIKESRVVNIEKERQYIGHNDEEAVYKVIFGNVTVNQYPRNLESDQSYEPIMAHEARVRGLTYQTEIYVAVEIKKCKKGKRASDGAPIIVEEK